jgi:transcriptional regulator with PAS, ATPase and Fis domain
MSRDLSLVFDGRIVDLEPGGRLQIGEGRGHEVALCDGPHRRIARIEVDLSGGARVSAESGALRVRGAVTREHVLRDGDVLQFGRARLIVARRLMRGPADGAAVAWQSIIAGSRVGLAQIEGLARVAGSVAPVWIAGESGTGKELAARAIHASSGRAAGAFVAVNCAALPENLVESELFGVERGAYTGAMKTRAGAFAQAHGGTLLLDEIGELPLAAQAKLLRALETGEVQPVGGERRIRVDVRVLCASWRDLEAEVEAGRFRHDLLHRLWVLRADLPPLRERAGDIVPMLREMLGREHADHLFPDPTLLARLLAHAWPGNVRELRNCVARAVAADEAHAMLPRPARVGVERRKGSGRESTVRHAIDQHRGNRARTARALGVSRSTLYRWLAAEGRNADMNREGSARHEARLVVNP